MWHFFSDQGLIANTHHTWLCATIVVAIVMSLLDSMLVNEQVPSGIVNFELAVRNEAQISTIMDAWSDSEKQWAAFSLGFDYILMICYSNWLAASCIWVSGMGFYPGFGILIAWGQTAAALLDAIENLGLIVILTSSGKLWREWGPLTSYCVCAKFTLLGLGVAYSTCGFLLMKCGKRAADQLTSTKKR